MLFYKKDFKMSTFVDSYLSLQIILVLKIFALRFLSLKELDSVIINNLLASLERRENME